MGAWAWAGMTAAGLAATVWGAVALVDRLEREPAEVVQGPALTVVRKCRPPERGWCVVAVDRVDGPVPDDCECGPMPKEYAALQEPDRSWQVLQEYRRQVRREARRK